MFKHVRLGCSDVEKGAAFYDAAMGPLGFERTDMMGMAIYGLGGDQILIIANPAEGDPGYPNGMTIGFYASSTEAVDAFHAGGVANGGKDEGAPGPREYAPGSYAAYLRDPDGNKICAYAQLPEAD